MGQGAGTPTWDEVTAALSSSPLEAVFQFREG